MRGTLRRLVWLLCTVAVASCGGGGRAPDFTLHDDGGSPWTLSQQRGKVVLLTFGFTRCADTCPATVAKLTRLRPSTHGGTREVEVAFVTIDPARDTISVMHRYVARFAKAGGVPIVGLTGTPAEIERVKAVYHVWSAPTAHDVAHTAVIFLIDPQGRLRSVRDDNDSQASLARAVAQMLPAS